MRERFCPENGQVLGTSPGGVREAQQEKGAACHTVHHPGLMDGYSGLPTRRERAADLETRVFAPGPFCCLNVCTV